MNSTTILRIITTFLNSPTISINSNCSSQTNYWDFFNNYFYLEGEKIVDFQKIPLKIFIRTLFLFERVLPTLRYTKSLVETKKNLSTFYHFRVNLVCYLFTKFCVIDLTVDPRADVKVEDT